MAAKELTSDQRFSRVTKDPRFWEMPEKEKKIKIDKRFRAMFHDKKFSLKYTVDKRGRPINHSTTEDLKRYYDLSDSDEDVLSDKETVLHTKKEKKKTKQKKKDPAKSKDTSSKIMKEKTQAETSEGKSKAEKKVKAKGDKVSKPKITSEEISTKEKPSGSVPTKMEKKSAKVIELEEPEEESGLEDESDLDSNDEMMSEEEMSNVELEEEEESDGESGDDDSEGEESEEDEEGTSSGEEEDSDSDPDLARGKGNIETSSEDEEDDEDDQLDLPGAENEIEHSWREMDKEAPRGDEVTRRLAVCNMDWDRLKAKDLLALFNSFKPKGGIVFSVKIYPSEFGKERLKEEGLQGPTELKNVSEDVSEEKLAFKEKLREYQFKRLKYYYGVVECDTPETANKIYEECDGLEFERSCSFVDLRFVPDDAQFNDEPKDSAVDVDLASYKPKYFTTAGVVTSKVELTWDETDQDRVTALNKPFKKSEILDMDFQAYLASSSEEEEEEIVQETEVSPKPEDAKSKRGPKGDDEQIQRYRQLLKGIQEKEKKQQEKDIEMEVKWVPGLKESAEQMVKNKLEGKDKLTPWEKYLQKQKDKKKLKRKKKESEEESDEEDDVPSDVDLHDPFFSEELKKPGLQKKSTGGKTQEEQETFIDEEEKEKREAEMALLMMDDVEDDRKHFNFDKIVEQNNLSRSKMKKLKKKDKLVEDDFQINVEDTRFQAMYTSHLYSVDPSDPNFKKTKAMEKVLEEKARRREQEQSNYTETIKRQQEKLKAGDETGTSAKKTVDPALSALLKSIKSKTQQFQASKKQKTK